MNIESFYLPQEKRLQAKDQDLLASENLSTRPAGMTGLKYRAAIDGLRAVAVIAVFVFHLNRSWLPGGFVGVDIFFVISGFLITSILLKDMDHEKFSYWKFYQRRIARLMPAFYAMALATIIACIYCYSTMSAASNGLSLAGAALSVANMRYMLVGNYFKFTPDTQPFLHCWSLSVEEQFYMFFPALLLIACARYNRFRVWILAALGVSSLILCVALTYTRPDWAFYLLPTRAWELMTGGMISVIGVSSLRMLRVKPQLIALSGLILILLSFFMVREGNGFPGYIALIPVLGAAGVLGFEENGIADKILSAKPLVMIGKMSYSLYLWHWPIFCLVDYKFVFASPAFRIALKVVLSAMLALLCFYFIERPGRTFFNKPANRRFAYGFFFSALACFVCAGLILKQTLYVDSPHPLVAKGGRGFHSDSKNGSVVLMGDSNGSMYGKMLSEISDQLQMKLNVISVDAGNPLPQDSGKDSKLWNDSIAFIQRTHPDFVILACNWTINRGLLNEAVARLRQNTRTLILITQPPQMPVWASRESIRNGSRPPFWEEQREQKERNSMNQLIKGMEGGNVKVLDIEKAITLPNGSIRLVDGQGRFVYEDEQHLTGAGSELVKPLLLDAILR